MSPKFNGKQYTQASAHQQEWGERLIQELHFKGDEKILDLGCGHGVLTAKLAALTPHGHVLGIDGSKDMLKAAQKHAQYNTSFKHLLFTEINYSQTYDLVFSNAALHWEPDHKLLLQKAHEALKPGGRVRFRFGGHGNCENLIRVLREVMGYGYFKPLFQDFKWPWYLATEKEYKKLMREQGFLNIRVWLENADKFFPSAGPLIKWVDTPCLVPFLTYLPVAHKLPFRAQVISRMLEISKQENGTYFETFRRLNVSANR